MPSNNKDTPLKYLGFSHCTPEVNTLVRLCCSTLCMNYTVRDTWRCHV